MIFSKFFSSCSQIRDHFFSGRISRSRYVKIFIIWHLAAVPLFFFLIFKILSAHGDLIRDNLATWGSLGLFFIATLLFWERLNTQRFQDLGRPKRHLWLIYPEVDLSFQYHFLDLFFKEGDSGENPYGKRP